MTKTYGKEVMWAGIYKLLWWVLGLGQGWRYARARWKSSASPPSAALLPAHAPQPDAPLLCLPPCPLLLAGPSLSSWAVRIWGRRGGRGRVALSLRARPVAP